MDEAEDEFVDLEDLEEATNGKKKKSQDDSWETDEEVEIK